MKILVIDDDHMVRYTLSKILRNSGYEVVTAADGERGMTAFHAEKPDVVITDLIMPEQEGIETILQIKRARPEVRIIAISGGGRIANTDVLQAARGLGADEILAKPFEAEELLSRLGHADPFGAAIRRAAS